MAGFFGPVTAALLAALEPRPGDTVLELAGGPGELAEVLAPRVARLVSTDLSPKMVEAARRRGLNGVEHRVLDMQELDLPDDSVDKAVCRFGYMLVPDSLRAMKETRRVVRPGGRVAFATWAVAKRNPWATVFGPVLVERGLMEAPQPGEPGQFALGESAVVEELARRAGFADVRVEDVSLTFRFADCDDYRRVITGMAVSMRDALEGLDPAAHADVDAAARTRFEPFRRGDEYVLPGVALVARAVRR
jgi:SAM-dependent methyltransferase